MAVSAKFVADFSSFNQAVERATVELRSFEGSIGRVDKDLAKFGNQFSGVKIIQDATLMAKAVEDIGGASRLTDKEMARVNAQVTEAIVKFRALGQTAPKSLLDLEAATRRADDATKGLNTRMVAVGSAIGSFVGNLASDAIFSAGRALLEMGKSAFDSAGQILDLSNRTGLATDTIQQMQYVADQTGASLEQFTQAAFQLGVRLSGGGNSVKAGIEALGLSLTDLQRLSPDEQFDTIADALGRMDDATKRNEIGVALFGKAFASIAAGVAEGYKSMASEARLSSEAQLQALDKTGDAWARFVTNTKGLVTSGLGSALAFIENQWELLLPVVDENGRAIKFVGESVKQTTKAVESGIPSLEEIEDRMRASAQAASDLAREAERAAKAKAAFWAEVQVASQEMAWYYAKVQPMPAVLQSMAASTAILGSRTHDLSKAIHTIDWNPLSQGASAFARIQAESTGFFAGINQGFKDLVKGMTGGNGLSGFLQNMGKGLVDGFGQLLSGGISSLINVGLQLAAKGIAKIGSIIGDFIGGGEHSRVNDMRDEFFAQFGGAGTGAGSGFLALAERLSAITGEAGGGGLFAALTGAKTEEAFRRAVAAITALLDQFEDATTSPAAEAGAEAIEDAGLSIGDLAGVTEETITKLHAAMQAMGGDMLAFAATLRDPVVAAINETIAALDRIPRVIDVAVRYASGTPSAPSLGGAAPANAFAMAGPGADALGGGDVAAAVTRSNAALGARIDTLVTTMQREVAAQIAISRGKGMSYAT
jgi:hypothetical protein